jgi:hypothetical protein
MQCSMRKVRRRAATTVGFLALLATGPAAIASQADFVFDALGPAACEVPPPSFDIAQFRAFADGNPDAPIARGEIGGTMETAFAGGGLYGADEAGGFVVGVQGMLLDDAADLTMLCLVLTRLGDSDEKAGAIVGEAGMGAAVDGSFLGVFKLVRRDADGRAATYASGTVERGEASFGMFDGILVEGKITIDGAYTLVGSEEARPLTARITIPRAENVLSPALILSRG